MIAKYQRSGRLIYLCPGCLRFSNFNLYFSKTAGLIETKLHAERPWDGGIKVCTWDLGHMTKIAAMTKYGKQMKSFLPGLKGP